VTGGSSVAASDPDGEIGVVEKRQNGFAGSVLPSDRCRVPRLPLRPRTRFGHKVSRLFSAISVASPIFCAIVAGYDQRR